MRAPRLFVAVLLAFLLAFAQQAAAIHALSHFTEDKQDRQEKHLPGAKACEKCAAYAKVDSGPPSNTAVFHSPQLIQFLTCAVINGAAPSKRTPYQSRAPPPTA